MKVFSIDDDALELERNSSDSPQDLVGSPAIITCEDSGSGEGACELESISHEGSDLLHYISEYCPQASVVLINSPDGSDQVFPAIRYRGINYVLKPVQNNGDLFSAVPKTESVTEARLTDAPPWYSCDESLRTSVTEALRRGDMVCIGELLISEPVLSALAEPQDMLGIQLLNYLFSYQEGWGKGLDQLDANRQKAMREYWKLGNFQERLRYLAASYYDLMESVAEFKGSYTNPIVSYCQQTIDEQFMDSNFNISTLASTMHLSLPYLSTVFKNATGQKISAYLSKRRLEYAQQLLRDSFIPIRDICLRSGYDDPRYFARFFKKHTGMTPSEFRNLYAAPSASEQLPQD